VAFHPADFKSIKNTQSIIPRELAHPIPIFRKILAREKILAQPVKIQSS
jgi:hypothetical protein